METFHCRHDPWDHKPSTVWFKVINLAGHTEGSCNKEKEQSLSAGHCMYAPKAFATSRLGN